MKKLFELLGTKRVNGEYGIEIEVEGRYLPHELTDKRWRAEQDGSLRGENMEYILAKPLKKADVRDALESLAGELKNSKLDFSFRTSVHVHMNVQNLTFNQYLALLYTYLLLEEPLVNFCGKSRKGNRFCLRLQDAEGILEMFDKLFRKGDEYLHAIHIDGVRYASVNIGATVQYGSLEFRAMRGTMDVDTLVTWVEMLDAVKRFAINLDDPYEVYEFFADVGAEEFPIAVLGEALAGQLYYPRMIGELKRSFSLSLDLPFAYKEYKEKVKVVEVKKAKPVVAAMPQGWIVQPAPQVIENVDELVRLDF